MRRRSRRSRWQRAWVSLAILVLCGIPSMTLAQVATHSLYQGRLTETTGAPKTGPVNLKLRIFDAATSGTPLYSEEHLAVALGNGGSFAVALGNGTNPTGSYATALQTAAALYLEIEADGDLLSPRQAIASAPVAVAAASHPPPPNRFEACANGLTIADHQMGLLWEKKTGTVASAVVCHTDPSGCPEPRDVNNTYRWSSSESAPDGEAFLDFIAKLNDPFLESASVATDVTGCFAGHCDWRLPNIVELRSIVKAPCSPCIDPAFGATGSSFYWTASRRGESFPTLAWAAGFHNSSFSVVPKTVGRFVRAVRTGSCDE